MLELAHNVGASSESCISSLTMLEVDHNVGASSQSWRKLEIEKFFSLRKEDIHIFIENASKTWNVPNSIEKAQN